MSVNPPSMEKEEGLGGGSTKGPALGWRVGAVRRRRRREGGVRRSGALISGVSTHLEGLLGLGAHLAALERPKPQLGSWSAANLLKLAQQRLLEVPVRIRG